MIRFISLGPGDPELITVKGLNALRRSDVIFCPATRIKAANGEGVERTLSRAAEIVKALGIDEGRIELFHLPMSLQREEAQDAYNQLYKAVLDKSKRCEVAVVAEGDAGFYASIHYVYERLVAAKVPVQQIAGVPAFIAAGAVAGLHIVKQRERLQVIPGTATAYELIEWVEAGQSCVIMKLNGCQAAVRTCMVAHPEFEYHYFEQVGTANERYITDKEQLMRLAFPYCSLMIIRKREGQA